MASNYDKKVPDYRKEVPEFKKKVLEFKKAHKSDKKYLKKVGGHIGWNVYTYHNKDEDISPKNQNYSHQASSQKYK